ncbi:MAG TPA: polysaccharide deacetylase family protein [Syntrophomonadaceae bacterium]|nr:polysaccharide deacetylase family protein [Syntrophomonadaceae bacterium]
MKKPGFFIAGLLFLILIVGASVIYLHDHQQAGNTSPTGLSNNQTPAAQEKVQEPSKEQPGAVSAEKPYVLPILGSSGRLTKAQVASMDQWRKSVREMALQQPEEIILNGKADQKAVSLTFDDGPDGVITPQVLTLLKNRGIYATFFFVGKQMESYPQVVKDAAAQGHLILSHTYSHPQLDHLQQAAMQKEVERTDQLLVKLISQQPVGLRPPYGAINTDVVTQLERQGKVIILWSIDTLDWTGTDAKNVAANVLDNVRPGDIILMHSISGRNNTLAALPLIIDGLREKGYSIVRVDQLLDRRL